MRVQIVDPPAFTPPYDRALCAALAGAGAEVELLTSRFEYGPVAPAEGYRVNELFYRRATERGLERRGRRALRLAEHVPGMLRLRTEAGRADVVHLQWLSLPTVDRLLLPGRPRVFTVHYPLPSGAGARSRQRLVLGAMDALIAHTEHGAQSLLELGLEPGRVHRIPHGVFEHLKHQPDERPLPAELARAEGPVILFFGLLRPYKGIDILLRAFRDLEGAQLWIVGAPRMPLDGLRRLASACRGTVRFVPRFITDPEIPAYFRRADVVVLPYREIEQSGVLYTALAFGRPIVASAVGGFTEVGERNGALKLVPAGDPGSLAESLAELIASRGARDALSAAAGRAAATEYSWASIAERTLALYRGLGSG